MSPPSSLRSRHIDNLIAQLPDDFVRALAASGVVRNIQKNTLLLLEGTKSDAVFVILAGNVRVYAADADGREIVIEMRGAGEVIGELAVDGVARSASVATTEASVVSELSHAALREAVATNPDFAWQFILKLVGRVRSATTTARDLALLDVRGRLIKLLTALATDANGELAIAHLTQQEICERIGASRDMVARVLKSLTDAGDITLTGKRIALHRPLID